MSDALLGVDVATVLRELAQTNDEFLDGLAFASLAVVGHSHALRELRAFVHKSRGQELDDVLERVAIVGLPQRVIDAEHLRADAREKSGLLDGRLGGFELGRRHRHLEAS